MTFDFKTLKDNTFCIYDVKEGQADKIKVIMEELGIKVKEEDESIYYFRSSHIGNNSYLAYEKIVFGYLASHKETYRKTATEFLEEYGEWKGESKLKFKVGDKVKWLETGFVGTIKRHCKTFGDSWYINDEYNSCSENNLELIEDKELYYKQYIGKKYAVHCKTANKTIIDILIKEGIREGTIDANYEYIRVDLNKGGWNNSAEMLEDKGYTILSVEEFFGEEEKYIPKIEDTALYIYNNAMINKEIKHEADETYEEACIRNHYKPTPIIKPNIIKKTMNTIKKVLRSKEDKALAHFDLGTSKELNLNGRTEFTDFIYETGKTDRAEFLKKIVKAYEEDKK